MTYAIVFCFGVVFLLTVGLTPLVRRFAIRYKIFDQPDDVLKIQKESTPLLGGMAMLGGFVLSLLLVSFVFGSQAESLRLPGSRNLLGCVMSPGAALILGCVGVSLLGLYDDIFSVSATKKLLLQIVLILAVGWLGIRFRWFTPLDARYLTGFGSEILNIAVSVICFLVFMNAINLLDGLDGLAAGVCAIACFFLACSETLSGSPLSVGCLCFLVSGASLGFLMYNFHPAKIFMGDSGSLLLGFLLASIFILLNQTEFELRRLSLCSLPFILPLADLGWTILRRAFRQRPVTVGDRGHIYDRLLQKGLGYKRTVGVFYLITGLGGIISLILWK